MKKLSNRVIWGLILIVLGVMFLLQQLNLVGDPFESAILILMGAGGAAFLFTYFQDRKQWWAAIPGMALLGIAFAGLESLWNFLPGGEWGGAVFLGSLGAAFWLVYLRGQVEWWAIIPGGVLVTLALVAGLEPLAVDGGAVFFLGLAGTFGLVAVLPPAAEQTQWAWIPAGVLAVLGLTILPGLSGVLVNYWPVALILVGVYVIVKNWL